MSRMSHVHPSHAISSTCSSIIPTGSVTEIFKPLQPKELKESRGLDELVIDRYLGAYFPERRVIEIYPNAIYECAERLNVSKSTLLDIVRLHEYVHAINHVGILPSEFSEVTFDPLVKDPTYTMDSFYDERTKTFLKMSDELLEQIAQAITYASIQNYEPLPGLEQAVIKENMLNAFESLEAKCSVIYQLSPETKRIAPNIEWEYVIESAIRKPNQSFAEITYDEHLVTR